MAPIIQLSVAADAMYPAVGGARSGRGRWIGALVSVRDTNEPILGESSVRRGRPRSTFAPIGAYVSQGDTNQPILRPVEEAHRRAALDGFEPVVVADADRSEDLFVVGLGASYSAVGATHTPRRRR